jgi:hypothetical protein
LQELSSEGQEVACKTLIYDCPSPSEQRCAGGNRLSMETGMHVGSTVFEDGI